MTDVGVMVLDGAGEAVTSTAMNDPLLEFVVNNPQPDADSVSLTLRIDAAFAWRDKEHKTPIEIRIDHLYKEPIDIAVTQHGESDVAFVPGIPTELKFKLDAAPPTVPNGMHSVGYLRFRERHTNDTMLEVPIEIGE